MVHWFDSAGLFVHLMWAKGKGKHGIMLLYPPGLSQNLWLGGTQGLTHFSWCCVNKYLFPQNTWMLCLGQGSVYKKLRDSSVKGYCDSWACCTLNPDQIVSIGTLLLLCQILYINRSHIPKSRCICKGSLWSCFLLWALKLIYLWIFCLLKQLFSVCGKQIVR